MIRFNNSGLVNTSDLSGYSNYFTSSDSLTTEEYSIIDMNGDGFINVFDFYIFIEIAAQAVETPIPDYIKLRAYRNATNKILPTPSSGIQIRDLGFGSEFYNAYATIDSTDAYELQVIADYCDSVTTTTDTLKLWKDGKRAILEFSTP